MSNAEDFISRCSAASRAAATIEKYSRQTDIFLAWAKERKKEITPDQFLVYVAERIDGEVNIAGKIRRRLSVETYRQIVAAAKNAGIINEIQWHQNGAQRIIKNLDRKENITRRAAKPVAASVIMAILNRAIMAHNTGDLIRERNYLSVSFQWAAALRGGELLSLTKDDFCFATREVIIHAAKRQSPAMARRLDVSSPTPKLNNFYAKLWGILPHYLFSRACYAFPAAIGAQECKLGRGGYEKIIKSIGMEMGLTISPHSFRRGAATGFNEATVPLPEIKERLRHKSLKTTKSYID